MLRDTGPMSITVLITPLLSFHRGHTEDPSVSGGHFSKHFSCAKIVQLMWISKGQASGFAPVIFRSAENVVHLTCNDIWVMTAPALRRRNLESGPRMTWKERTASEMPWEILHTTLSLFTFFLSHCQSLSYTNVTVQHTQNCKREGNLYSFKSLWHSEIWKVHSFTFIWGQCLSLMSRTYRSPQWTNCLQESPVLFI